MWLQLLTISLNFRVHFNILHGLCYYPLPYSILHSSSIFVWKSVHVFAMSDLCHFSDWDFPGAGSFICGNQDGINKEIFILCSINRWLCQSWCAMDRLRTSMHAILATYPSLGRCMLIAWICCWCLATVVLLGYSKEGTTQRVHEEGIDMQKNAWFCSLGNINATHLTHMQIVSRLRIPKCLICF